MSYKYATIGDILAKKADLSEQELQDLSSIYGLMRNNVDYLIQIALKKDISVAEVYYETIRSQQLIKARMEEMRKEHGNR